MEKQVVALRKIRSTRREIMAIVKRAGFVPRRVDVMWEKNWKTTNYELVVPHNYDPSQDATAKPVGLVIIHENHKNQKFLEEPPKELDGTVSQVVSRFIK